MADLRELIVLSPEVMSTGPESSLKRRLSDAKMALRRWVIASSRVRLIRRLYQAIYAAHFALVTAIARRFAGTRAVYGAGGVNAGDMHVGVSDIDIAIYGDWPEKRQFTLLKVFGFLTVLSPLYDRNCMVNICTVPDLERMAATDMLFAMMYARGRVQWKLLYGEDVLAGLPPMAPERFAGGIATDVRRWWESVTAITFGTGVMGRDPVFRNSICFKAVAEMLRAEDMLQHGLQTLPRRVVLERERARGGPDSTLLDALLESSRTGFLKRGDDLRAATTEWLLARMEPFHAAVAHAPSFSGMGQVRVEGTAEERYVAPETMAHCQRVLEIAKRAWPTLQAAYLVPTVTMLSPDSLALLLHVDSAPGMDMLRAVSAEHGRTRDTSPQSLRLYLMLRHGAYMIELGERLDLFYVTLTPEATPDIYASIAKEGFALFGPAYEPAEEVQWTPFAAETLAEEFHARQQAFRRFGVVSRPKALANLRNFWRYLQLLVIDHTSKEDTVTLPVTVPAIERAIVLWKPALKDDLLALRQMFTVSLLGDSSPSERAGVVMQRVYEQLAEGARVPAQSSEDSPVFSEAS